MMQSMADMAGWGTFIVEHVIFGMMLGLAVAASRQLARPALTARRASVVAA